MKPIAALFMLLITVSILAAGCAAPGGDDATPAERETDTEIPTITATRTANATPVREGNVTVELVAQDEAFDQSAIVVPAGAEVTVEFENMDTVPHNLAVYRTSDAADPIFVGEIIDRGSIVYTFTAPETPGMYFFRCDVHPTTMTGNFIVI